MVGALFSSDAWNNITFAAAEVRDPARTVPLSLMIGTSVVSTLYIAANLVYLAALPLAGEAGAATALGRGIQFAASDRVATAAIEVTLGTSRRRGHGARHHDLDLRLRERADPGGARVYYAMAQDGLFFPVAGLLNTRRVPAAALVLQGIWAALLTLSGTYGDLLDYVIFAALLFYVLTVGAVFVLRRTQPDVPRPYRAVGYPDRAGGVHRAGRADHDRSADRQAALHLARPADRGVGGSGLLLVAPTGSVARHPCY